MQPRRSRALSLAALSVAGDEKASTAGVVAYLLGVFVLSWSCWFLAARVGGVGQSVLAAVGAMAPGVAAIVAMLLTGRLAALRSLLGRLVKWRVGWQWYAFAILFMPATRLGAAMLFRLTYGHWPPFGHESLALLLVATLASVLLLGQAGEELGWRGYALPRLCTKIGLGPASLFLGAIWAIWHLPLFFLFPQADKYGQSFTLYFTQVTAISVVISWLWWRTGGSLLLTMLFHAAVNNLKDIVPATVAGANHILSVSGAPVAWLSVAVLWIFALILLPHMRSAAIVDVGVPVPSHRLEATTLS